MVVEAVTVTDRLMACPSCSQEMHVDDDGTLPLHSWGEVGICSGSYGPGQPSRSGPQIRAPYVVSQIDRAAALEALESRECWGCGQPKRRGNAVCKRCFKSVRPIDVRTYLYLEVGNGFEKNFALALADLKQQWEERTAEKPELFSQVA